MHIAFQIIYGDLKVKSPDENKICEFEIKLHQWKVKSEDKNICTKKKKQKIVNVVDGQNRQYEFFPYFYSTATALRPQWYLKTIMVS